MTPGRQWAWCVVVVWDEERGVGEEAGLDFVAERTMDIAVAVGRVAGGEGKLDGLRLQ